MKDLIQWRWKTLEGEIVTLKTIETSHAIYIIRMLWNQLAEKYPCFRKIDENPGGRRTKGPDREKILAVLILLKEIEEKREIPKRLETLYFNLRNEIFRAGFKIKELDYENTRHKNK